MIEFIKKLFRKKRHCYQVQLIATKDNEMLFKTESMISVNKKEDILDRRKIIKSCFNDAECHIKTNRLFSGCKLTTKVICYIGKF